MTNGIPVVTNGHELSDTLRVLDAIGILPIIDREQCETRPRDLERLSVQVCEATEPDLFRPLAVGLPLTLEVLRARKPERIRIVVSPVCWLDITQSIDPLRLQAFLTLYRGTPAPMPPDIAGSRWSRAVLDDTATAWAPDVNLAAVVRLWSHVVDKRLDLAPIEMATTARVYGNKVRLAPSIASVIRAYLPDGSHVADLMCGSGVVSRVLSNSFEVLANDVNPWASSFARLQLCEVQREDVDRFLEHLAGPYAANFAGGSSVVADELRMEAEFLYGPVDADAVERYRTFCAEPLLATNQRLSSMVEADQRLRRSSPMLLTLALFANAYFGVRQSLAIDSIRRAIAQEPDEELRNTWLAVLLLAATVCGSGPHFAQPPKISSERSMRELIEHRSRDVLTEFTQLLRLLAQRPARARMRSTVRCGDWRDALASFAADPQSGGGAVYVDPPYTRLQYARYYHVLNTLIDYRFSPPAGVGRYPRKDMRPSSKFDGRERTARLELEDLLAAAAGHSLVAFLSYSSTGMVSLPELCRVMEARFRQVDTYTVPLRHHSQGRPFTDQRGRVDEFVLVGLP
jgi:hypothetical protein